MTNHNQHQPPPQCDFGPLLVYEENCKKIREANQLKATTMIDGLCFVLTGVIALGLILFAM